MTSPAYDFRTQLLDGAQAETTLDTHFSRWYRITPATEAQQRSGIDRVFARLDTGEIYTIEYKCDHTAARTGNAFVETISVNPAPGSPATPKKGWAYTSRARYLLYFVPGDDLIYVIRMATLRQNLPLWKDQYPERSVGNRGYTTHGLLVPLDEFERCADQVISL
ncbi:MAG: hypothetical protein DCC55_25730 [Chloroflexi bacterium]|nr:MAG: hypothetical protein DCC55_25730 [Chloroflexota bacterium]